MAGPSLWDAYNRWSVTSGRQRTTAVAYATRVRLLDVFGVRSLEDATSPVRIAEYMDARMRGGACAATVNVDLASLLSILGHAARVGLLADARVLEPLRRLRIPTPPRNALAARHLDRPTFEKIAAALHEIDAACELALQIIARAGLRCGEVLRLHVENVHLDRREIELPWRTKNRRPRSTPIVHELHEILERRLPKRPGLIFPARREGTRLPHMHPQTLRQNLAHAAKVAGLREHVVPKLLRASCASWWAQEGGESMNVIKIAKVMGHSPEVAEQYYLGLRGGYDPAFERPEHRKLAPVIVPEAPAPRFADTTILLPTSAAPAPLSPDDTMRLEAAQRVLARILETGTRKLTDDEAARLNSRCVSMTLDGRRA